MREVTPVEDPHLLRELPIAFVETRPLRIGRRPRDHRGARRRTRGREARERRVQRIPRDALLVHEHLVLTRR